MKMGKRGNVFIPLGIILLSIILIIALVTTGISLLWLIFRNFILAALGAIALKFGLNFATRKKGVKKRK